MSITYYGYYSISYCTDTLFFTVYLYCITIISTVHIFLKLFSLHQAVDLWLSYIQPWRYTASRLEQVLLRSARGTFYSGVSISGVSGDRLVADVPSAKFCTPWYILVYHTRICTRIVWSYIDCAGRIGLQYTLRSTASSSLALFSSQRASTSWSATRVLAWRWMRSTDSRSSTRLPTLRPSFSHFSVRP